MNYGKDARSLSTITDHVFLGGINGVKDVAMMEEAGVTHVLNLARELSDLTYPACVKDVRFEDLRDSADQALLPYLDGFADHIHGVVTEGGNIAVHCVAGVSRSASTVMAYLMKYKDMSLKEAFEFTKVARSCIYPNHGFWIALIDYEFELKGITSVEMMPFTPGPTPSIDQYRKDMLHRIKLGWMDHVFYNILCHSVILVAQVVSMFYFS